MIRLGVTLLTALGLLVPGSGSAQLQRRFSFDATIGGARIRSPAPFVERSSILAEGVFAIRWSREPGNSFIAAVGFAGDPVTSGYDASCQLLPNGSCAPRLPLLVSRHVVFGWERLAADNASLRLMVGPAKYEPRHGGEQSDGFQLRLDLGAGPLGRVAPMISGRWSHVASYQNAEIDFYSVSLGFRLR